jgi:hypothetical protein
MRPAYRTSADPGRLDHRPAAGRVDGDALDDAVGAWLAALAGDGIQDETPAAVAVDGKTLRGARDIDGDQPHLLFAVSHDGVVLAQRQVDVESNEITAFAPLLE